MSAAISRRTFVKLTVGVGIGGATLPLAACAPTPPRAGTSPGSTTTGAPGATGAASTPVKMRLGVTTGATNFPFNIADQFGYFPKHNIDVERITYADFDALAAALRRNDLDGAQTGIATLVKMRSEGVPLVITFGAVMFTNPVLVLRDSPITAFPELKGKRIGIFGGPAGATTRLFLSICLAYFGFDPNTEAAVQFGAPALLAGLLERGDIDAFLGLDPIASTALAGGKVRSIGDLGDIYREKQGEVALSGGMTFMQEYAERHPDAVIGLNSAFVEGVKYLRENPQAWIPLSKSMGIENEAVATLVRERTQDRLQTVWDDQAVAAQLRALEFIQRYAGKDFLEIIDPAVFTTKYAPRNV